MSDYRALDAPIKKYTKKIVKETLEAVNAVIDLNTNKYGFVYADELKRGLTKVFHDILEGNE